MFYQSVYPDLLERRTFAESKAVFSFCPFHRSCSSFLGDLRCSAMGKEDHTSSRPLSPSGSVAILFVLVIDKRARTPNLEPMGRSWNSRLHGVSHVHKCSSWFCVSI